MPTPIELLLDPVSLTVFALYGALMCWEALAPARELPRIRGWRRMGLASFAAYFFASAYLPLLWTDALARFRLFDLTGLGTWGGLAAGLAVFETGLYAWHRALHRSDVLWRVCHQMHHSAERHDTFGAFWFSPFDVAGFALLGSLCLTLVVGLTPQAATATLLVTTFCSAFQHANIRTPRWPGYAIQRPESHSLHHQRGVHAGNYADLPLLDMLFGTFRNPRTFARRQGFHDGASRRVWDMLRWRDVSAPAAVRAVPTSAARAAR